MKQTYEGACHCGRVRFEVDADIDHVRVCDCSVCYKRGALNFRVHQDDFRPLTPLDEMTLYQWHQDLERLLLSGLRHPAVPYTENAQRRRNDLDN